MTTFDDELERQIARVFDDDDLVRQVAMAFDVPVYVMSGLRPPRANDVAQTWAYWWEYYRPPWTSAGLVTPARQPLARRRSRR